MKKFKVDFAVTYEIEATSEEQAIEQAEQLFYGDDLRHRLFEIFGMNAEEIKERLK